MELETVNKLYLELSQVATATTARELSLVTALRRTRQALADYLPAHRKEISDVGLQVVTVAESAAREHAMSEWQPIATAPKDVLILLYGAKRMEFAVGMNHSRDGWVSDSTAEFLSMYPPTHWMPLPHRPKAA